MTTDLDTPPIALVTGASRGLGLATARELADHGWRLIVDGRDRASLRRAADALPHGAVLAAIPGDVADPDHRAELTSAARSAGRLDLLVNNASTLGPTPLRRLVDLAPAAVAEVIAVNVLAPLDLVRRSVDLLEHAGGVVVDVSSDAAVEAYEGWGAYGASKAALDHATRVLALEHPRVRWYAFDPGDMDTDLHGAADPEADPGELARPADVAVLLRRLVDSGRASGRVAATELADRAPVLR